MCWVPSERRPGMSRPSGLRYRETSGFSWDNHKGANIVGAAAEQVWKEYVGKKYIFAHYTTLA
ncbi:hypothetical protein JVU11DRAFT_338 [Chiua virens]|nr:hypothetical protein JVU11DRAFT_338 [Chiua virens]